jgi:hypothetical protein
VGVTFGLGEQNGISFQVGANNAKGRANGSETTYDNTQLTATNNLTLKSGNDTNLIGAQAAGKTVKMDVGGQLNVQSLQDSSNYESKQTTGGFGLSLCIPPFCYGTPVTGSVSASKQQIDHNYQSTTGQSGIAAGTGGFDIKVAGATDLKGAAITSEADKSENSLSTSALTYSDLNNQQNTSASSSSMSVGYGGGSMVSTLASNVTGNLLGNALNSSGLPESGSQSSVTQSVISPAQVTITGGDKKSEENVATLTSRDASTANGALKNTLTLQQAQELESQLRKAKENAIAAQYIGSVITNAIGDLAQKNEWLEGSWQKIALHGVAGVIQAKVAGTSALTGAAAGAINEMLLPQIQAYLESQGIRRYNADGTPNADFNALMTAGSTLAGAAIGAAAGGANGTGAGAMIAFNATVNNRLLHENEKAKIKELANGNAEREQKLADAACYLTHCSAGKADSDPIKQDLVAQEARGKGFAAEISLLQNTGLFTYTDADRRLDQLNSLDAKGISGLNKTELEAKNREIAACRTVEACEQGVKTRYDRLTSDRTETVLTSINVMKVYDQCGVDLSCVTGSLAQMRALLTDMKAKGLKIADTERIGLSAYISNAEGALSGMVSYGMLNAAAMASIGAHGSEAGNARAALAVKNVTAPIDFDHVIGADYNKRGMPTGGHSLLNGDVRIKPGTETTPDVAGVYKAEPQMPDPKNPGQWIDKPLGSNGHTMFPKSWTVDRIKVEIDVAWTNRKIDPTNPNIWLGTTASGVKVQGYIQPNTTVYPVYQGPK